MDLMESAHRERRSTWVALIAVAAAIALLAPPAVEAATQKVKVKGPVKIKDSSGDDINSNNVPGMGLFDSAGSSGAVDVSVFAGGGGLLGTGDCETTGGRPNTTTVDVSNDTIITGILLAGPDTELSVAAPGLDPLIGPGSVISFSTTASNPNFTASLPTGLTVTPSELVFTCTAAGGGQGDGNYVILGQ